MSAYIPPPPPSPHRRLPEPAQGIVSGPGSRSGTGPAPGLVSGAGIAIRLSDASAMLLGLIAAHDGKSPASALDTLIAARAETIGVPGLLMESDFSRGANCAAHNAALPRKGADGPSALECSGGEASR